jgi:hypothetical protein
MMKDEKLSQNFWLSEFLRSETADRMAIDNSPDDRQLTNLRRNAQRMQEVRGLLDGHVIHVLSGLRVEALERVIAQNGYLAWCARYGKQVDAGSWAEYFARKQHPRGLATDWVCPGFGPPIACSRAVAESELPFDQLIYEYTWVHTSWSEAGEIPRREVMTLSGSGYVQGIVESGRGA